MERQMIDAKPLMENGWHLVKTGESNRFLDSMSLADVPTVDAVEVVRCEKCRYRSQYPDEHGLYKCGGMGIPDIGGYIAVRPEDFCSCGERKGNG